MKKSLLGLILAVAWSTVQAAPPEAVNREARPSHTGLTPGLSLLPGNCSNLTESTGFEPGGPDGWDAGTYQVCGATFDDGDCATGAQAAACTLPGPTENCCGDFPHPVNCWFTSSVSQSCTQPSVGPYNPKTGTQNLRMKVDPVEAGNSQGSQQAFTPLQDTLGDAYPSYVSFELNGTAAGNSELNFRAFGDGDSYATYVHFDTTTGTHNIYVEAPQGTKTFVGYWNPGVYKKVEIIRNPCRSPAWMGVPGLTTQYMYGGAVIYTHASGLMGPTHVRSNFLYIFPGATDVKVYDVDDFVINRGPECVPVCGDGFADAPEECDTGGGAIPADDSNCPGRCLADCTCDRVNVDCAHARQVENGDNGPFITDGGFFTYTADTEFITIDACATTTDTGIFWDLDADCYYYTEYNDDCVDYTYGDSQRIGTPAASCYSVTAPSGINPRLDQGKSCMSIPTMPGKTYTFAILYYNGATPDLGTEITFSINKALSPTLGGMCINNGAGNANEDGCPGTCPSAAASGANCALGTCDTTPVPDVCQGFCVAGLVGMPCKGDASCDVVLMPGHCDLNTMLCDVGMVGAVCLVDVDCDVPGIQGICMGLCQAIPTPCEGDPMCPPIPPTLLCLTGPRIGEACTTNAECNECTAPAAAAGADCTTNNSCRRCTRGKIGAPCPTGSALCRVCPVGTPNAGTTCTMATQEAVCGLFCALGDVGAVCATSADCTIEGEVVPGGACCDGWTGICRDGLSDPPITGPADCAGDQQVYSAGKLCQFEPPCIEHTGACCDGTPEAVHCTEGTDQEDDCTGPNLTWVKGVSCDPNPCPPLTLGACCDTLHGTCADNKTAAECAAIPNGQGFFTLDRVCGPNLPCSADLGACCDKDTFGGCTYITLAQCNAIPKGEWTKGQTCADIVCTHEPIPTVSQWGLVVLTLLLLVGAKVYFGRRQSAAA